MILAFDKRSFKRAMSWRFVLLFMPLWAVFSTMIFYHEAQEKERYLDFIEHKEQLRVQKLKEELFLEAEHLSQTVLSLSQYARRQDMSRPASLETFHALMSSVLQSNHHINSLSFFDVSAHEILLVSHEASRQNIDCEKDCPFPIHLHENQLFISGVRLKRTLGKVDHPLTAVMQLAMPVFSLSGVKQGTVVLSHINQHLYQQLDWANKAVPSQTMLLNKDAYWLYHPEKKYEWGSELRERSHLRLSHQNLELWQRIQKEGKGSFYDHSHLYTFQTIDLAQQLSESLLLDTEASARSAMPWVILSKYPHDAMQRQWNHQKDIYLFVLMSIFLFGILFFWCYALERLAMVKRKLKKNEYYLNQVQSLSDVGSWSWSDQRLYCSEQAYRIFGMTHMQSEMAFKTFLALIHPQDRKKVKLKLLECMNDQVDYEMTHRIIRHDNQSICTVQSSACVRMGEHNTMHMIGVIKDISAQLNDQEHMRVLVQEDVLTKIPNRRLFMDRLSQNVLYGQRENSYFSVLSIRVCDFKEMNCRLGHDVVDVLLYEVAQRLSHSVRGSDTVARTSSNVFTVLLRHTFQRHDLLCVCKNLRAILHAPIFIEKKKYVVDIAFGVACFPQDGDSVDTLSIHVSQALDVATETKSDVFYADLTQN